MHLLAYLYKVGVFSYILGLFIRSFTIPRILGALTGITLLALARLAWDADHKKIY